MAQIGTFLYKWKELIVAPLLFLSDITLIINKAILVFAGNATKVCCHNDP